MTKAGAIRLGIFFIALLVTCASASIAFILNTQYLTPTTQWLLRETFLPALHTEKVTYHFPFHFRLQNTQLTSDSPLINSIDLWFNPYQTNFDHIVLDSLLIDGAEITAQTSILSMMPDLIKLNQLAAKNITFTTENGAVFQNLDLQIEHPLWQREPLQTFPSGDIQLYAKKILWRGELLENVLLTGKFTPGHSSVQSLSFNWREGKISLAAQEKYQQWNISNLTAEKLDLSLSQIQQLQYKFHEIAALSINKIERLDILSSQFSSPHIKVINCDLSASGFSFSRQQNLLWTQNDARLSLSAESISMDSYQWIEPDLSAHLSPQKIDIEDFNGSILQGNVHFSGQFSPEKIKIQEMQLTGLKWFIEQDTVTRIPWLQTYAAHINELYADNIKLRNSQIIQLAHQPYWQLSGINLDASDAQIKTQRRWGLWNGSLSLSVNSLSYDDTIASQGVMEMHSHGNYWYLDRLFIPYTNGYMKASGEWAYQEKGAPWKMNVEANSLPLKLIHIFPFPLSGFSDFSLKANGLSGDSVILGHTLSGELKISIREGALKVNNQSMEFSMPDTLISADRGEINLPETPLGPEEGEATIRGNWNLAETGTNQLILSLKKTEHQYDLLKPATPTAEKDLSGETPEP